MIIANTRVLASGLTGVPRYVSEIMRYMPAEVRTVAPAHRLSGGRGHGWEQAVLPLRLGGGLLWSPSNTGPLAVARQVVTVHDLVPLDHPEWMNRTFATWYRFLLPLLVRRVCRVIAISAFTRSRLLAVTQVPPERITVIPNGVDACFHPRPPGETQAAISALQLPSRRYLLTLGSLEPRKNLGRLLAAWGSIQSRLPDDLWLVVAGAKGQPQVFAAATGVEALPPRVHLTGYIADDLLPSLLAGATAFAYVSEYEGFGLPPLEAMASGIPVLVAEGTAFPEVVGEAGLYASPYDVGAIANGLLRLLSDPDLAAEYGRRGVERARQFSWRQTAALTWQVLRDAAAEG